MLVTKQIEIDMGHRVPNHKSKCRNLHGHRYTIEVGVDGNVITTKGRTNEGMVIDFGDLKAIMMSVIDEQFDHASVFYKEDKYIELFKFMKEDGQKIVFVPFVPTAENLAKHWYQLLSSLLRKVKIKIKYVKVFETPTSTAIYEH